MAQSVRISLATYNALTDTDPRHYSLFADQDNVLIKEKARGNSSVVNGATLSVTHSLGYSPDFFVYAETSTAGRYRVNNGYDIPGAAIKSYVNNTYLKVLNQLGATRTIKYYIFYDNIN